MYALRLPRIASGLSRALLFQLGLLLVGALPVSAAATTTWREMTFEYVGRAEYTYPFDGRSPKALVQIRNDAATTSPVINFSLAIVGLQGYPAPVDGGGFATFPNGGSIVLAPGETTIVSCWTGGIYEGRFGNTPPLVNQSKDYDFEFIFSLASTQPGDVDTSVRLAQTIRFTNLGDNPTLTGPLTVSGRVRLAGPATQLPQVEVTTSKMNWSSPTQIQSDGDGYPFTRTLVDRSDWYLRFWAPGFVSAVVPVGDGTTPIEVTLEPLPQIPFNYTVQTTVQTPTGFWRGAVSESEGTFACFPGQENWSRGSSDAEARAIVEAGRIYKYNFAGTKLWEHAPGWEIWGGDMTPDGAYVAYVLNPTFYSFYTPTTFKLVLLDGATGNVLWTKSAPTQDPVGRQLEALELAMSPDGNWIAVGSTGSGSVTLIDRTNGNTAWSVPGPGQTGFGQVRKLKFSADSTMLYCGSGDMYLRKLRVSDGAILWRTRIGGWPFVNGFSLSPDGAYIATGTKSFDTAVVRASDGALQWITESGDLDAAMSPDGEKVVTFGGRIYDRATGVMTGHCALGATSQWTPDGQFVMKHDRALTIHDRGGKTVATFSPTGIGQGGGEQAQWSYVTSDGRYAIALGRDMNTPPETGIAIYARQASADDLPVVTTDPSSRTVAAGESVVLQAGGDGLGPLSFQWYRDGVYLDGATGSQLVLQNLAAGDAGAYTVVITNALGRASSSSANLSLLPASSASRINNFSIRCFAGTGSNTLIVGLVTGGSGTTGAQPLLIRGIGPGLAQYGVTGTVIDPLIEMYQGAGVVDGNDDWAGDATVANIASQVQAFSLPTNSLDAALYRPDIARNSYTVHVRGKNDTTGVALAEIYDATASGSITSTTPRLINVSARALVGSGSEILIPGFVISGSSPKTVLIRAIGPSLAQFGVSGLMTDPELLLYSGSTQIGFNDNWGDDPAAVASHSAVFSSVGAFQLEEGGSDAVIIATLDPGLYTAHLRGVNGGTGVALVEVYEVAN